MGATASAHSFASAPLQWRVHVVTLRLQSHRQVLRLVALRQLPQRMFAYASSEDAMREGNWQEHKNSVDAFDMGLDCKADYGID